MITEIRDDDGVPMALVATSPDGVIPVAVPRAGAVPAVVPRPGAAPPAMLSACLLTCPRAAVGERVLVHSGYVLEVLEESP